MDEGAMVLALFKDFARRSALAASRPFAALQAAPRP
jgi:hypothetical protein